MVPKEAEDGHEYNSVYIHFDSFHFTEKAENFKKQVFQGKKQTRVYYDDKWYWICLPNKGTKRLPNERKPIIDVNYFNIQQSDKPKCQDVLYQEQEQYEIDEIDIALEQADEIDRALEEEDQKNDEDLITIDSRYIQALEQENSEMSYQIQALNNIVANLHYLLTVEKNKVSELFPEKLELVRQINEEVFHKIEEYYN